MRYVKNQVIWDKPVQEIGDRILVQKPVRTTTGCSSTNGNLSLVWVCVHLLPAHTAQTHSHLYFGYKLPVQHVPLGLAPVFTKDRATLHIQTTHSINTRKHPTTTSLGRVYKRALVVPSSCPHQRPFVCGACIGTAQFGVSLVSLFRSTLQTV